MTDIDCTEFVEHVTEFLEGSLDATSEQRVVDHLALCDGCGRYLEQFRRTMDELGRIHEEDVAELPDQARDALLAAFRDRRR